MSQVDRERLSGPLAAALDLVGDRWSLLVLGALLDGPKRFGELAARVPGAATNILSNRLRRLERDGLIVSEAYSTRPLRREYSAAAPALELAAPLRLLAAWASRFEDDAEPATHAACGTALEVRYFCPTCEQVAEEDGEIWI